MLVAAMSLAWRLHQILWVLLKTWKGKNHKNFAIHKNNISKVLRGSSMETLSEKWLNILWLWFWFISLCFFSSVNVIILLE